MMPDALLRLRKSRQHTCVGHEKDKILVFI